MTLPREGRRKDRAGVVVALIAAAAAAVLSTRYPTTAFAVIVGAGLLIILVRWPRQLSTVLLVGAVLFMRPLLFGERYSPISVVLAVVAAAVEVTGGGRKLPMSRSARAMLFWLAAVWLWEIALLMRPGTSAGDAVRGIVDVPLVIGCAAIVLRDGPRRERVLRSIVVLVAATCLSFVVTLVLWRIRGVGSFFLSTIPGGYEVNTLGVPVAGAPMYFPFTTTYSSSNGLPRFLGVGQESGVTAAVIAATYFLLPMIGWKRWWVQALLIVGLIGTQSTAGFGVFLVVFALQMVIPRGRLGSLKSLVRQWSGVALLALAVYLAVWAPVLGVQAKTVANRVSVAERSQATLRGLSSVTEHPLGQRLEGPQARNAGINVIAGIAIIGVPGATLLLLSLVRPLVVSRRRKEAAAPVLVVIGTVVAAQPLTNSTAFFLFVLLACEGVLVTADANAPSASADPLGRPLVTVPLAAVGRST